MNSVPEDDDDMYSVQDDDDVHWVQGMCIRYRIMWVMTIDVFLWVFVQVNVSDDDMMCTVQDDDDVLLSCRYVYVYSVQDYDDVHQVQGNVGDDDRCAPLGIRYTNLWLEQ